MIRRLLLLSLLGPATAFAQAAPASPAIAPCGAATLAPMPATVPAPEMARPEQAVGACINLLSYVERVRRPADAPAAPAADDQMAYRFYMTQNGRQMTAAEFDAWMASKGIRVATGRAAPTTGTAAAEAATSQPVPAAAPAPQAVGCAPATTVAVATC